LNQDSIKEYDVNKDKFKVYIKNQNPIWGFVIKDEKTGLYVEESPVHINGETEYYGDIKIIDRDTMKVKKIIGEKNTNENSAFFYKNSVVYISDKSDKKSLYCYEMESGKDYKLSEGNEDCIYPVVNENAEKVLYQMYNYEKSGWDIYIYDFKNRKNEKFDSRGKNLEYPNWSENGNKIVFEEADADKTYITYFDYKTNKLKRISSNGAELFPVFSEDSNKILYVSDKQLYYYDIDKDRNERISNFKDEQSISNPKWIDNEKIIFERAESEGNREIYIFNIKDKTEKFLDKGIMPYIEI